MEYDFIQINQAIKKDIYNYINSQIKFDKMKVKTIKLN